MSFFSTATAVPIVRTGSKLLRGATLTAMAQGVGVIVTAAILAAVYQLIQDETCDVIADIRTRRRLRHTRHESLLMEILGSPLLPEIQDCLLYSRDAFRACLNLLADPFVEMEDKALIRQILRQVHGSRPR